LAGARFYDSTGTLGFDLSNSSGERRTRGIIVVEPDTNTLFAVNLSETPTRRRVTVNMKDWGTEQRPWGKVDPEVQRRVANSLGIE
jgi:hypothetical protein